MFCRPGCQFWLTLTHSFRYPQPPSRQSSDHRVPAKVSSQLRNSKGAPDSWLHTIGWSQNPRVQVLKSFKSGFKTAAGDPPPGGLQIWHHTLKYEKKKEN